MSKLLIIDDDRQVRDMMVRILSSSYQVLAASNVEQAREYLGVDQITKSWCRPDPFRAALTRTQWNPAANRLRKWG